MLKVYKFNSIEELDRFLQGSVMGSVPLVLVAGKVHGLHNLTLIINSSTVTFSDASGAGLTLAEIKTAITGAVAGSSIEWDSGRLVIAHASGVSVDKDGTANRFFGFDKATDSAGTVYNAWDGTAPRLLETNPAPTGDGIYAIVEVS